MKQFISLESILIFFLLFINLSCKKGSDCGCGAEVVNRYLPRTGGELLYNQNKGRWMLSYSPGRGAFSNFFPCNTGQDSLQVILQGANQTQSFVVWFSGNIKGPCPNEDFGYTNALTSFEYIELDSLSRN